MTKDAGNLMIAVGHIENMPYIESILNYAPITISSL